MDEVSAIISTLHTGSKNWLQPKKLGCRRRAVIRTEFEGDVANFMSLVGGFVPSISAVMLQAPPLHGCWAIRRLSGFSSTCRRSRALSFPLLLCSVVFLPGLFQRGCAEPLGFVPGRAHRRNPKKIPMVQNVGIWSAGRSERRRRASCPRRTQRSARQTCTSRFGRGPCHGLQTFRVSAEKDWVCMKMSFSPESDHAGRTTFSRPTKIE